MDEIGLTSDKYVPLNRTLSSLPLKLTIEPMSTQRWQLMQVCSPGGVRFLAQAVTTCALFGWVAMRNPLLCLASLGLAYDPRVRPGQIPCPRPLDLSGDRVRTAGDSRKDLPSSLVR